MFNAFSDLDFNSTVYFAILIICSVDFVTSYLKVLFNSQGFFNQQHDIYVIFLVFLSSLQVRLKFPFQIVENQHLCCRCRSIQNRLRISQLWRKSRLASQTTQTQQFAVILKQNQPKPSKAFSFFETFFTKSESIQLIIRQQKMKHIQCLERNTKR